MRVTVEQQTRQILPTNIVAGSTKNRQHPINDISSPTTADLPDANTINPDRQPTNTYSQSSSPCQPPNTYSLNSATYQPTNTYSPTSSTSQPINTYPLSSSTSSDQPTHSYLQLSSSCQPINTYSLTSSTSEPTNTYSPTSSSCQPANTYPSSSATSQPTDTHLQPSSSDRPNNTYPPSLSTSSHQPINTYSSSGATWQPINTCQPSSPDHRCSPDQHQSNRSHPSDTFTITLRGMEQPRSAGRSIVAATPLQSFQAALDVRDWPASEPVLEWPSKVQLAILDIDYHSLPMDKRPAPHQLDALAMRICPQPALYWRSHGRGLHLLYSAGGGFTAEELAACAAVHVRSLDPTATIEILSRTRHPHYPRADHSEAGPIVQGSPAFEIGMLARWLGKSADDDTIDAWL